MGIDHLRIVARSWAGPFVAGLYLYFTIPSNWMFPVDEETTSPWHPGYFGWYDVALFGLILISLCFSRARPSARTIRAMTVALVCIVCSVISTSVPFEGSLAIMAGLYWLRFAAVFAVMVTVTTDLGLEVTASIVTSLGLILMTTSLFVLSLQYGSFNRMYASGMTVASFSQAMLIVAWVAIMMSRLPMAILASAFLLFTFSRTAILLWLAGIMVYVSAFSDIRHGRKVVTMLLLALACGGATYYAIGNSEFAEVIADRLDRSQFDSLSDRTPIWQFGNELLTTGRIPITGVGFGNTGGLLTEMSTQVGSFHSIVYEYIIGMGILCIPIFAWLIQRLVQAFRAGLVMAGMILLLFLVSQAVDFTFYRPKEVVIWAVFLGLAEGELQLAARRKQGLRQGVANHAGGWNSHWRTLDQAELRS